MSAVTRRGALTLLPAATALLWPPKALAKPASRNLLAEARQHYEAFAAILDEATADHHGWVIRGGARSPRFQTVSARDCLVVSMVRYETGTEPRCPSLIVERHHEIVGLNRDFGEWHCIRGIRSRLCLRGWRWSEADAVARDIVSKALLRVGARRPTWAEGQPEYAQIGAGALIERTWCVRCHVALPEGHTKFCGDLCANATHLMQLHRQRRDESKAYDVVVNPGGSLQWL